VAHVAGWFGLAGVLFFAVELPLWIFPGMPPQIADAAASAAYLASIKTIALTRIVLDMAMYASLMVFFAGFRHVIIRKDAQYEWLATLTLVAGAVWWAVSLVADGLEGGAVLHATSGRVDPIAVRVLQESTLLIYNGAVAFAVTGLFMAAAGYAIVGSGALPAWTGRLAYISALLCAVAIPSMYVGVVDHTRFYNVAGWGPAFAANAPPLVWFLAVSVQLVRLR
jgi:hypothetical protein